MGRTYKNKSIVSGKSINDIMRMNVSKLNQKELRLVVGRLVSAGNKRLRTFEKSGMESPSYSYVMKKGRFSTRGKNVNELRSEFSRARDFISSETGSVQKWKKVKKKVVKSLKENNVNVKESNLEDIFKAYEKLKELDPNVTNKTLKYRVLSELSTQDFNKKSTDDIITELSNRISDIYESQYNGDDAYDITRYFKIDEDI